MDGQTHTRRQYVVDAMLDVAHVKPGDTVYDLGCNDGRVVLTAVSKKECLGVGYEVDGTAINKAKEACKKLPPEVQKRVTLIEGDAFEAPLKDADVLFLYLLPKGIRKLQQKLDRELKPGTRVVTYLFKLPEELGKWAAEPKRVVGVSKPNSKFDTSDISKLYLYEVPAAKGAARLVGAALAVVGGALAVFARTRASAGR